MTATTTSYMPTYTDRFGECLADINDYLFGTEAQPQVGLTVGDKKLERERLIAQFHEKLKSFLLDGTWLIHYLVEHGGDGTYIILIDNLLNYYSVYRAYHEPLTWHKGTCCSKIIFSISDKGEAQYIHPCPLASIPLSDGLITSVKKIDTTPSNIYGKYSGGVRVYHPCQFIISTTLESYRAQARTEYLLYQQAKALEESRATNKMLEARLSVLEALLLPTPSAPKEIDLLGLHTTEPSPTPPLTHDLRTAVMDASDIPSLIITDSHSS